MKKVIIVLILVIVIGSGVFLGWLFLIKKDSDTKQNVNTSQGAINNQDIVDRMSNWKPFLNPKNNNLDLKLLIVNGINHKLSEIHAMPFGGTSQKILVLADVEVFPSQDDAVLSPNGKKLALNKSYLPYQEGLQLMNTDGSDNQDLLNLDNSSTDLNEWYKVIDSFIWSSDSKSILYILRKREPGIAFEGEIFEYEFWKINIETKENERINIETSEGIKRLVGWSSENNEIYLTNYLSEEEILFKFLIINDNNGDINESIDLRLREKIANPYENLLTVVSPDYSKAAIFNESEFKLELIDLLNLKIEDYGEFNDTYEHVEYGFTHRIRWSPDSKKISLSGGKNIFLIDIESKKSEKIISDNLSIALDFSPDNNYIFYITIENAPPATIDIFSDDEEEINKMGEWYWQARVKKTNIHRVKIDGTDDIVLKEGWGIRSLGWGY